MEHNKIVFFII